MSGKQPVAAPAGARPALTPRDALAFHRRDTPEVPAARRAFQWAVHRGLRSLMGLYAVLMRVATWMAPPRRPRRGEGYEILVTGTFHSDNWVVSHIRPLAMSKRCARLRVVSASPVPPMDKVEAIYPPTWLSRSVGPVLARLATFAWVARRTRPHVVGGFHLLVNGLVAALVGRLSGSWSLYFCVGGPAEVLNGGIAAENRLFGKMGAPDPVIEERLVQAVRAFDLVITMGSSAISYFRERGVAAGLHVVSGGFDASRFRPAATPPPTDLILVGRLAPIKRIDLFLGAIKHVQSILPGVTATVVGEGPLRCSLQQLARELGIDRHVTFVGHQRNVDEWLRRAKLFVLTSDSEGLALSLIEAMLCGLPAIVSRVGDLGDLVTDGVNGYLVSERSPEAFAGRIVDVLTDPGRLAELSEAARHTASRYEMAAVSRLWDGILANLDGCLTGS